MKTEIQNQLHDPKQLEKLYRSNKVQFKHSFDRLYPTLQGNAIADVWHERLSDENEDVVNWGTSKALVYLVLAALLAGLIAKLPALLSISEDFFYPRNIGFIVFPLLTAYFAWKNKLSGSKIACIVGAGLAGLVFINLLPDVKKSDTLILSCIHLVLFLWAILGFAFVGGKGDQVDQRLGYLRYNGDLVVMTTLILIAGGIMTAITIGLFSLIGFHIEKFYFDYVGIFGLAAAPIVGTYLTQTNPQLVGKVSPVIAKLFSPLVAVMLSIYLVSIVYSGKDPYNDREFLVTFNALLIGVLAMIFFSVAETARSIKNRFAVAVLLCLAVLTVIVNGIALSAIVFRISEWGITPNRAAVLGANVLILVNLVLVMLQLFRVWFKKATLGTVGRTIALYLPIYLLWTIIVTFIFPLLFGFR